MSGYNYIETFKKFNLDITDGKGTHRGHPWCIEDQEGVLYLMAHQNFIKCGGYIYENPADPNTNFESYPVRVSMERLQASKESGRPVKLLLADFQKDAAPSKFKESRGIGFIAHWGQLDTTTGYIRLKVDTKSRFTF